MTSRAGKIRDSVTVNVPAFRPVNLQILMAGVKERGRRGTLVRNLQTSLREWIPRRIFGILRLFRMKASVGLNISDARVRLVGFDSLILCREVAFRRCSLRLEMRQSPAGPEQKKQ